MSKNRREFFRVDFDGLIDGEIRREGWEEALPIEIENVSAGGLVFYSPEEFPMDEKVECSFSILGRPFLLDGSIVRKTKKMVMNEHGVAFTVDQGTSSELFKQLNYYQIRQRKGDLIEE